MILNNIISAPIVDLEELMVERFSNLEMRYFPFRVAQAWGMKFDSPQYMILDALWRNARTQDTQALLHILDWSQKKLQEDG